MLWQTKDGRVMDMRDMTDTHLRNAIAHMERRLVDMRKEESAAWFCMSMFRGEVAQDAVQASIDDIEEAISDAEIALQDLKDERERRATTP